MSDYLKPALAVALPNLGGLAGVPINRRNRAQWFDLLKKPAWKPPDRVFAPMWTFLYSSMGYASYLVWRDGGGFSGAAMKPLTVYGAQLVLNWAWTPIFFGLRSLKWGLVEMVGLWGAVAATIYTFYPVSRVAAGLLVPYLGWLTLATTLTYTMWRDNKARAE
ncbi:hypothetical protein BaRGS_00025508 [Batillaria attramentaria]|uniref:Translocator protein n=1 Tax=Batillaria attramentaria TaxID=370345 RepID=A0ABD0K824_9CAEN